MAPLQNCLIGSSEEGPQSMFLSKINRFISKLCKIFTLTRAMVHMWCDCFVNEAYHVNA